MMCLAVEASHLPDIGNSGEGLLKQTQYLKPLGSLYELRGGDGRKRRVCLI